MHELSVCCSGLFSKQTIEVAIECWSWVISSRIDVEPLVIEEMINAWQMTVDLRLGMFSPTVDEPNPLAKEEKDELKPPEDMAPILDESDEEEQEPEENEGQQKQRRRAGCEQKLKMARE